MAKIIIKCTCGVCGINDLTGKTMQPSYANPAKFQCIVCERVEKILRFNMGGEACCEIMDMGPGNTTSLPRGKWWNTPILIVKGGLGLDGLSTVATLEQLYRAAELELTAMTLDIEDEKERHIMTYMVESGMFSGPGFRLPGASNYIAKVRSDEALKAFYSDYKGDKEKLNRVPCLRQAITLGC